MIDQSQGVAPIAEQAEAERLESLGRLAGGIAHDFNNLLAVISNYAAFVSGAIEISLRTGDVAPLGEAMRDIEQIALASDRASTRTRQLLAFARRETAHPRPIYVNDLVADVVRQYPPPERIVVTTGLAVNLPPVVADAVQIEQVLLNLIANAYEAMPNGGAVRVSTAYAPRGDMPGVEICVRDSGVGMSDEVKSLAFEPFFTTKDLGAGVGLGLATVHGVVANAGGCIEIDTTRGYGTTVVAWLPAQVP